VFDTTEDMKAYLSAYMGNISTNEPQFWPIIKSCTIKVDIEVLHHLNIIDLPGLHDTNVGREEITKKHLQQSSNFLVLVGKHEGIAVSPVIKKIMKDDIIIKGIPSCVVATKLDALSCDDVKNNNDIVRDLDSSQIISFERENINQIALSKFSELIKEYSEKSKYSNAEMNSIPFFGVSSEAFSTLSENDDIKFPDASKTGITDIKSWVQQLSISKEVEYHQLLGEMFKITASNSLKDIKSQQDKNEFHEFFLSKTEDFIKQDFYLFEDDIDECVDKAPGVVNSIKKKVKWNTFKALIREFGEFRELNCNQDLLFPLQESFDKKMTSVFNLLEDSYITTIISKLSSINKNRKIGNYKEIELSLKKDIITLFRTTRKKLPDQLRDEFKSRMKKVYIETNKVNIGLGYYDKAFSTFKEGLIENQYYVFIFQETLDATCQKFVDTVMTSDLFNNFLDKVSEFNQVGNTTKEKKLIEDFVLALKQNKKKIFYMKN